MNLLEPGTALAVFGYDIVGGERVDGSADRAAVQSIEILPSTKAERLGRHPVPLRTLLPPFSKVDFRLEVLLRRHQWADGYPPPTVWSGALLVLTQPPGPPIWAEVRVEIGIRPQTMRASCGEVFNRPPRVYFGPPEGCPPMDPE